MPFGEKLLSYDVWSFYLHNGFLRRYRRRSRSSKVDVVIQYDKDDDLWTTHPFYWMLPWPKFTGKTPESLMFKIDLFLLENNCELNEPFIFPDDF